MDVSPGLYGDKLWFKPAKQPFSRENEKQGKKTDDPSPFQPVSSSIAGMVSCFNYAIIKPKKQILG